MYRYRPQHSSAGSILGRRFLVAAVAVFLLVPALAAAINCPVPNLPRPAGDHAAIRAELEAQGLWKTTDDPALSPPPDPQLGDTWLWYVWNLGGYPTADLKPATVRGMGDHCYVVVDDEEWNVGMTQADVDRIVDRFENLSIGDFPDQGIWDLNTSHFGDPPNPLDGLDRVFLFYYRFNIAADGFFWVYDQFPDGSQPFASNECDVVYMATDSGTPGSDYMIAVMAHEFQHLIHYARDANESTWLDEGLAELAMWLYGRPDTISSFNSNPDNSLVNWGSAWADYIQCYLWTLYCYEQYGGQPMIWSLIHNPANSMTSYQQTFDGLMYNVSTQDVFDDWSVANFLDDLTVPDGEFGYAGDDLPPFYAWRTHSTFPVEGTGNVQTTATDYVRLTNLTAAPTITFDGWDSANWRISLMAQDAVLPTLVTEMPLDGAFSGSLNFAAADGYDEVVISIANVSETNTGPYQYSVDFGTTDAPGAALAATVTAQPNPFNPRTELRYTVPVAGHARLRVYAADGRLVRTVVDADMEAGTHSSIWLGRDDTGRAVPSGVYLVQLETPAGAQATKVMLVR